MRLDKVKRPAGVFSFEVERLAEDDYGVWLFIPAGSRWVAPHDSGVLPADNLALVAPGRPLVAWWHADTWWVPGVRGPSLGVDICLAAERTEEGWSYVDLELD